MHIVQHAHEQLPVDGRINATASNVFPSGSLHTTVHVPVVRGRCFVGYFVLTCLDLMVGLQNSSVNLPEQKPFCQENTRSVRLSLHKVFHAP